jgi:paired amphipathic helix protein Sin3a
MLKTSPLKALPVVISRLKAKIDSWKKTSKFDSERVWKETIERNFYKSLDHRSFYFKQNEKKMTNPKSFLSDAKSRYMSREDSKSMLRKYLKKELTQHSFEFLGGSRNTLFFNSFSGLSSGVIHKVHPQFKDDVIEEFQVLDSIEKKTFYANSQEYATLPHFRLLFTCEDTLFDSVRIILYALERTSQPERMKIDRWLGSIFQEFLGIRLPDDVLGYRFDEFFEADDGKCRGVSGGSTGNDCKMDTAKKIIDKWITSANYTDSDVGGSCLSENVQDPMSLKKDQSFVSFLPLLKDNQLMYGPSSVYTFIRFFYDIYERLLKVKLILSQSGKEEESKKLEYGEYEFDNRVESEYLLFLKTVCQALRGLVDSSKFEEKCRNILGNDSYVFFTFDKLVNFAAKSLQALTSDDFANKTAALHSRFAKSRLNEEMYLVEVLGVAPQSQIFRFHWNPKYRIVSITYVESPYEKLNELGVKNAQKYRKSFLSTPSALHVLEDIKSLLSRIEAYIRSSDLSLSELVTGLFYYQNTKYGMVENSQKMFYIPEGEDFLINSRFYSHHSLIEGEENFICYDKNSLFQKFSEVSEKKFKVFRSSKLSEST